MLSLSSIFLCHHKWETQKVIPVHYLSVITPNKTFYDHDEHHQICTKCGDLRKVKL